MRLFGAQYFPNPREAMDLLQDFFGETKKENSLALSPHFINRSWTLPSHTNKRKTWKNPYSIHLCDYKMVFLGDYTILPLGFPWNTHFITPYAEETSQ